MKKVTVKAVQKMVAEANASGSITCSYIYENGKNNHNIHFSNGAKLTFENSSISGKVFRILKHELLFEQNFNWQSDEHDGIIQAAQLGENPFAFSIICANPNFNGTFQ